MQDIVYIKPIDETEVMDSVTKGKEQVEAINQAFIAVDEECASRLEETQDDLATMQTFLSEMSTKFVDSASISSYSVASTQDMEAYQTMKDYIYDKDNVISAAMYGDNLESLTMKEIEKGKNEVLNELGKEGKDNLNQAYINLETGKIDKSGYTNILQSELADSIEQGHMSGESSANLWEYINENKGDIGLDIAKDAVKEGGEQAGLAFLRKRLNDTIDKGAVQGPKGEDSFRMMDKETVKEVDETKSKNAKLTKYGKWAGKGLTAVGLYSGYQGNIDEGKTAGEAISHTGSTFLAGAGGTAVATALFSE